MEGGEKQEERKIQKRRQGEGREHVSLWGGGGVTYGSGLITSLPQK